MMEIEGVDDRERWVKMIVALDTAYVAHVNDRLSKDRESARRQSQGRAKRHGRR